MLIACPECEKSVSDMAVACPHCGFPVSEGIRQAVADVTEERKLRSVRQKAAAAKLKVWGERYVKMDKDIIPADEPFFFRHRTAFIVLIVAVVLTLQLTWVFSLLG